VNPIRKDEPLKSCGVSGQTEKLSRNFDWDYDFVENAAQQLGLFYAAKV
jgi:hypothetical protein